MLPKWPSDGSSHRARWCKGGTGKAEDAKLQDAGINMGPEKMSGRKRAGSTGKIGAVLAETCEQVKRNRKNQSRRNRHRFDNGAGFE